jgi:hypothetical protein
MLTKRGSRLLVAAMRVPATHLPTGRLPCRAPCAEEVRRERGRVLVHCMSGLSRSAVVAMHYLMRCNSWRLRWAAALLVEQFECVCVCGGGGGG